ncbi:hypothetical protein [Clostridium sardiniense]|uniref:hypothetical protein n=1 Tax=Clostridium sardiniense TaxID=29369 RepID=UPI00195E084B|nr:hypothetical protein [Clostridium sardiniense]MBM7836427.1 NTP pyrophosphatase (non-canonical NTP hydrolase) [Clostridium sardiniense]
MKNTDEKDIYRKVLLEFGSNMQKIVCMEECAELQQALSKDIRHDNHNVEEEIADVEIMIGQMKLLYDIDKIEKIKAEKLKRISDIVDH